MTCSKIDLGLLLLLTLTSACRGDEAAPAPRAREADKFVFKKKEPPPKPARYTDEAGNLLPSGEKILWFEVPKGFTRNDNGRVHQLTAKGVSLEKLEEYVAARVLARKFDRMARGGSYVEARSPEDPKRAPLDIMLSEGFQPGEVFLRVTEYMPAALNPMPLDQVRSALLQDQKQAE
jgi:hypothetical protein